MRFLIAVLFTVALLTGAATVAQPANPVASHEPTGPANIPFGFQVK